jgi:hypothetical protein
MGFNDYVFNSLNQKKKSLSEKRFQFRKPSHKPNVYLDYGNRQDHKVKNFKNAKK